ncbi:MAG: imidazole glycerol phosphate synthase, glutamine amidotransferase subunit [Bacteroidetes bacterium GWE2_29_8]|nr:MAG: imidazole glycerol phosphate synthase, glutamine amidotransferase subunit [Bacteroidetes bacterium GWE2_29_8]OFY20045.1 MAG: imidazole glycerol phosphate synthase, glutamine amidotransferase subunit [Bacteroidetes bacterium GWF2_29_10]
MDKIKIVIIDYKLSNLFSVEHACKYFGVEPIISSDWNELKDADGVILPGVGAFADAMYNLNDLDLIAPIKDYIESGRPFMGICLGLQLLFTESEEFKNTKGLDIIRGQIKKFSSIKNEKKIKVPQIGWNNILKKNNADNWETSALKSIKENEYMYFVHSFYAVPSNQEDILCVTNYEQIKYCSAILKNNIFATQFHPEKSARKGLIIYENWLNKIKYGK